MGKHPECAAVAYRAAHKILVEWVKATKMPWSCMKDAVLAKLSRAWRTADGIGEALRTGKEE